MVELGFNDHGYFTAAVSAICRGKNLLSAYPYGVNDAIVGQGDESAEPILTYFRAPESFGEQTIPIVVDYLKVGVFADFEISKCFFEGQSFGSAERRRSEK